MADKGSEDVETGQFSDEDLKGHWKSPHWTTSQRGNEDTCLGIKEKDQL